MKKITALIGFLSLLFVMLTPNAAKASALGDIPDKYALEIYYLIGEDVVSGYPTGEFKPNQPVTREEAATMVGRALNLNSAKRETSFTDVPASSYASGYIQSAVEAGILSGYGNGLYKPKNNITRLEMAFLLSNAFKLTEVSNITYADMPQDPAKATAIDKITTAGIAAGYPGDVYKPNQTITRAEFSLMIARALNKDFKIPSETEDVKPRIQSVNADILNLRAGPGTHYETIAKIPSDSKVQTYSQTGEWYFISYGSKKGYVHKDYLVDVHDGEIPEEPTPGEDPAPTDPAQKVIAIDAGHGGSDPGAVGNGLYEKNITLDVAKRLQKKLEADGIKVVMIRSDDTFVDLDERVRIASDSGADTFVSIHVNSYTDSSAKGTETYYYNSTSNPNSAISKQLAQAIQSRLVNALGTSDRGVKSSGFRVIKTNPLPSVLVELAFITNSADAAKLASSTYLDKAANALYLGIKDYYNN